MSTQKLQSEKWEVELEKRLKKLLEFLKFKNHGFCKNYLKSIIKDFFKNGNEIC